MNVLEIMHLIEIFLPIVQSQLTPGTPIYNAISQIGKIVAELDPQAKSAAAGISVSLPGGVSPPPNTKDVKELVDHFSKAC